MIFKACARCRGDLYREEDLGGTELVCALPAAPVPALDRLPCNLAWCSASRQRKPVRVAAKFSKGV